MALFTLITAQDMLAKAHRERERLGQQFHADHVFNFFITANHIKDYVKHSGSVKQVVLEEFQKDQDISDCRDICDKGKHFKLTKRFDPSTSQFSGCVGGAPVGMLPVAGGDVWMVEFENRSVDILVLARRVLEKWEKFLVDNMVYE